MARKLALLGISAAFLIFFLFQDRSGFTPSPTGSAEVPISNIPVSHCSLNQGRCLVELEGASVHFEIHPKRVPPLEPLKLIVKYDSPTELKEPLIWFSGRDMEMGVHFFQEVSTSESAESESSVRVFKGMIPVCTIDQRMVWQLHSQLTINHLRYEVVFDLTSSSHKT